MSWMVMLSRESLRICISSVRVCLHWRRGEEFDHILLEIYRFRQTDHPSTTVASVSCPSLPSPSRASRQQRRYRHASLSLSLAYLLPNLNIASAKNGALITICPWLEFVVLLFRSDPQIWVKDDRSVALLIFYSPETMMTLVSGKNRIFSLLASFFWDFYFMFCLSAGIKPGTPLVVPRNHEIPSHNRVINKIVFAKSNISA